jgi:ABC-2 type transport system permease protein
MRKVLAVVRREFVTRVHTRAFLIGTILGPLLMGGMFVMPILLSRQTQPRRIVILDGASGSFGARVERRLSAEMRDTVGAARPRYDVRRVATEPGRLAAVRDSLVALTGRAGAEAPGPHGILVLTDSAVATGRLQYVGTNVGSPGDMGALQRSLGDPVRLERLARAGVDPAIALPAMGPIRLSTLKVSEGRVTGESGGSSFALAYIMSFMLYFALLIYGMQVMTSVVEEKSSRIMEVLVSSLSPFEMLLGKVVGVGAVALLQLAIWAGTAMLLTTFRVQIAGLFGASPTAAALPLPTVSPALFLVFIVFFALGFLFYAAAYAAVGSMCNSVQETQQAQVPVTLFIAAGLLTMFTLLGDPSSGLARVLGLVPFVAPFVTPVRYSFAPLPLVELLASAAAMIAGVIAVVWVAARIYRVGILSYGKKASLADVFRWVRTA